MLVSVVLVRGLAAYLQRRGVPVEYFCERAGLSPERLGHPTDMLTRFEFQNAAVAARELSRDPAMGLRVGRDTPASFLGLVGNLMANCGTIRDAIETYIRFTSLVTPGSRWDLEEHGERAHLVYEEPASLGGARRFACEMSLASSMGFADLFVGMRYSPIEARLSYPAPEYAAEYEELCRCPVVFNAGRNELVFDRRLLDVQQVDADGLARHVLLEQADWLLQGRIAGASIVDRARVALHHEASLRAVDRTSLASHIGMSPAALSHRLAAEGERLTVLIAEAKRDLACRWLRDTNSSIKELADELGFSDRRSFHRAFKRWTGVTPGAYRTNLSDSHPMVWGARSQTGLAVG